MDYLNIKFYKWQNLITLIENNLEDEITSLLILKAIVEIIFGYIKYEQI